MKTHSNDHTMTTTTKTTAAVMMAMCGTFSRRAHSFWRPLGFLLVFLYFLQSFRRVWSTVATSTDTSATCNEQKEEQEELEEDVWRGRRCKILFFDSGVDQLGGAFTGVDWRRMKNTAVTPSGAAPTIHRVTGATFIIHCVIPYGSTG